MPTRKTADPGGSDSPGHRGAAIYRGHRLDVLVFGDIGSLLAAQLTRPAPARGALALACADADLLLLAAPDPAVAAAAAACGRGRVPLLEPPLEQRGTLAPGVLAALFAAGASGTVAPLLGNAVAEPGRAAAGRSGYPESPSRSQAEAFARA